MNTTRSPQNTADQPIRRQSSWSRWTLALAVGMLGLIIPPAVQAQVAVRPRQLSLVCRPGTRIHKTLEITNTKQEMAYVGLPRTIDLAKDRLGRWIPVADTAQDPRLSERSRSRSCRGWISLAKVDSGILMIQPVGATPVDVAIDIPSDAEGTYVAGVELTLPRKPESRAEPASLYVPITVEVETHKTASRVLDTPPVTHFGVRPMKLSVRSWPGRSIRTAIQLQNLTPNRVGLVNVKTVDLDRTASGPWIPVEPVAQAGARPERSRKTSCRTWISLESDERETLQVGPSESLTVPVEITIPSDTEGFFYGAIVVSLRTTPRTPAVATRYEFVVPVSVAVTSTAATDRMGTSSESQTMVLDPEPVKVRQDTLSGDPSHTYSGEGSIDLTTDLPVYLLTSAVAAGPGRGTWTSTSAAPVLSGPAHVTFALKGTDVRVNDMMGRPEDWKLAEVILRVIPRM